jgi:hypothetical protein
VKWQENALSPKGNVKVETTVTRTSKFYVKLIISIDSKTEQNMSHATSLLSERLKF